MNVRLISITPNAEDLIVYCARVSSPENQHNTATGPKLLAYLVRHKHWSPFEQAHMTVEIETSRAIAAQILRHRSFTFQEFSQRYALAVGFETYAARRQDQQNRQNSIDDMSQEDRDWFTQAQQTVQDTGSRLYDEAIARGVAKECARFLLPLSTRTRLYMTGSVRSWIHYFDARCDASTQLEHREISEAVLAIFKGELPDVARAMVVK